MQNPTCSSFDRFSLAGGFMRSACRERTPAYSCEEETRIIVVPATVPFISRLLCIKLTFRPREQ